MVTPTTGRESCVPREIYSRAAAGRGNDHLLGRRTEAIVEPQRRAAASRTESESPLWKTAAELATGGRGWMNGFGFVCQGASGVTSSLSPWH